MATKGTRHHRTTSSASSPATAAEAAERNVDRRRKLRVALKGEIGQNYARLQESNQPQQGAVEEVGKLSASLLARVADTMDVVASKVDGVVNTVASGLGANKEIHVSSGKLRGFLRNNLLNKLVNDGTVKMEDSGQYSTTHLDKRVYEPLHIGDIVYFSPIKSPDPLSKLLVADGFQSLRCGVTAPDRPQPCVPNIDRACFRIWSVGSASTIAEGGIAHTAGSSLADEQLGTAVTYGMPIVLEHVLSGQFLACSPRELADVEKECTKLLLVLNGASPACHFEFKPLLKSRSNGEVYLQDEVSLMNMRLDLLLHQAPSDSVYNTQANTPLVEVNLASNLETGTGCYEWKMHKFSMHSHKMQSCFQIGQPIRLNHPELGMLACVRKTTTDLESPDTFRFVDTSDGKVTTDASTIFIVEKPVAESGGELLWQNSYRLRHLVTGRYLTVDSGNIMQSNKPLPTLLSDTGFIDSPEQLESYFGSLFQFIPTKLVTQGKSVEKNDHTVHLQHTASSKKSYYIDDESDDEDEAARVKCYMAAGEPLGGQSLAVLYDLVGGAPLRVPLPSDDKISNTSTRPIVFSKTPQESDVIQLLPVSALEYQAVLFCLHCKEVADMYQRSLMDLTERRRKGQMVSLATDTSRSALTMLADLRILLSCPVIADHAGLVLSATQSETAIQQVELSRAVQRIVMQTGLLDELFQMLKAPKLAGLNWTEAAADEGMANIHRSVARSIVAIGRDNEHVQYHIARSQYHHIASTETQGQIRKRESFGYLAEVFDQLRFGFGASKLLQTLLTGNAYLLSALVDDEVISEVVVLLRQRGPARPILDLLGSMCRCQGETVVANQERLMRIVYSITENQHHIQYRRAMLIETMLQPAEQNSDPGDTILISWQGSPNYEPGILEITALYHDAETLGLNVVPVEENPSELQEYLERAHAANVPRKWVALEDIAWTLDPAHMYPKGKQWNLPANWSDYQLQCEENPAVMQQFQQWHAIASYYAGVLDLLHEFSSNRSYRCIEVLEKQFPFDMLLAAMADMRLPLRFRTLYSKLLYSLYVDRFPNEKLQFPSYLRFHPASTSDVEEKTDATDAHARIQTKSPDTRLHAIQDFISRYFETESDISLGAKCGTEMDDHNFAHSLLQIGHYLLSMGLYTASSKLTSHTSLLHRVLSQYCRKQAESRAARITQVELDGKIKGEDEPDADEQLLILSDGDEQRETKHDNDNDEARNEPDEGLGIGSGLLLQQLRKRINDVSERTMRSPEKPRMENDTDSAEAPRSPGIPDIQSITLCEDLQRICHIHDSLVQQTVEADKVWQNQRWRPGTSWFAESSIGARGEWSYRKYLKEAFENEQSPENNPSNEAGIKDFTWEWTSDWAVTPRSAAVVSEDPNGWLYAFNWPKKDTDYAPRSGANVYVRRRLWERLRRRRRAEDVAKALMQRGRAEKHVLRAFQSAANDVGAIDLLKALSILPTIEKQQPKTTNAVGFQMPTSFESLVYNEAERTTAAQQRCVVMALETLSTTLGVITDVRLSSFARQFVDIADKPSLIQGDVITKAGRELVLQAMTAEQLEGVDLAGPMLEQLVPILVLLSADEESQICDNSIRVLTLYFNRTNEFENAAEELDILIEPFAMTLYSLIQQPLAMLKNHVVILLHGGTQSVADNSDESTPYLQAVTEHFKTITKLMAGKDELSRKIALSIAQKLGVHRVALATIHHAIRDERAATHSILDIRKAASQCLVEFVRNHPSNQRRLAEYVPVLLPGLGLNIGVPRVIATVYQENFELCNSIPESLIQTYCKQIEEYGVELEQLWSYTDLMEYAMSVNGVPIRRSQNIVAKALLDKTYSRVCITFCEPADATDPTHSNEYTRRKDLLVRYDPTFEDPSARTLRYHAKCIRLLAFCCQGKHTANELKCRMQIPFEVVAKVLADSTTFRCPSVATAFAKFLFTVYLETDTNPKAILSGYDTIDITNHPLMWDCLATFAKAMLKYGNSSSDKLEGFVFEGALPCIELLFRKVISVQALLHGSSRHLLTQPSFSVSPVKVLNSIHDSLKAVSQNRSLSATQLAMLTETAKAVGLDSVDEIAASPIKRERTRSDVDMQRMQLQDDSFRVYYTYARAVRKDAQLQGLATSHFRELAQVVYSISSFPIKTPSGMLDSLVTSEAVVRRTIKAAREQAVVSSTGHIVRSKALLDRGAYRIIRQSRVMILNLLTALLDGHVSQELNVGPITGEGEEAVENAALVEMQLTMIIGGAAQLLVELIANSQESELVVAALAFGVALLDGGNRQVQESLFGYMHQTKNHRFFHWFDSRLLDISQGLRSWHRWREFHLMQAPTEEEDYAAIASAGDLQVEAALRNVTSRLHMENMLRFLQLMSEGHYTAMQLLMQAQPEFPVSHDLVSTVADVLSDIVPNVEILELLEPVELDGLIQVLEFLTEIIQGPCRSNQELLALTPAVQTAYMIVKWAPDVHSSHEIARFSLKASAATFLYSLIEGRVAAEDDPVFSALFKIIEISQIEDSLLRIYQNMKNTKANAVLCSKIMDEGFLLMSLARQLGQARPEVLESLTPRILAPGKKERYESLDDFEKARAEYHKQEKYRVAYEFINDRLRTVEVVWGDNGIVRVHYMRPRLCDFLTEETKEQTKQGIDYTDDDRAKTFLKTADTLFDDMSHKMMLASNPMSATFMAVLDEVDYLSICLAVLINFLLVISLKYDGKDPEYFPGYFGVIIQVLGVIQVCLTGLRLIQSSIVSGPLVLSAAYRHRLDLTMAHRKAPPIGKLKALQSVAECFRHFIASGVAVVCGAIFLELRYNDIAVGFVVFGVIVVALTFLRSVSKLGELPFLGSNHVLTVWTVAFKFLTHKRIRYKILFFVAALLAVITKPYFYSIQLLVLVQMSETLQNVVKAITMPAVALSMSALLAGICIYIFSFFGFWFFQSSFENEEQSINECDSLILCLSSFMHNGLIYGGGIADYLNNELGNAAHPADEHEYSTRLFYDLLYFIMIIVLALNMIFGIILDTFGQLREEATERRSLMENFCFVCELPKDDFDEHIRTTSTARSVSGFMYHVKHEHNMWDYLCFLIYLKDKDKMHYNGVESYVAELLEQDDFSWVPNGQALSIPTDNAVAEEHARRDNMLLQITAAVSRHNAELETTILQHIASLKHDQGSLKRAMTRVQNELATIRFHSTRDD